MTMINRRRFGETAATIATATVMAIMLTAQGTTYYAKSKGSKDDGSTRSGSLTNLVVWCTDPARTTLADPQPIITENDGNTYVYLSDSLTGTKLTNVSSFPEGTHLILGSDGVNVGTSATLFAPSCDSVDLTAADCTIYGLRLCPNYNSGGRLIGNYRLVKTATAIYFGASNLKDDVTYGYNLAGTFTGDDDVVIGCLAYKPVADPAKGNGIVQVKFSGDFSGYRGKFETIAFTTSGITTGHILVWFSSATSMGDPAFEFNDAITLRHRGYLQIDEAVTQSAARGITLDLSAGQFAGLFAPSAARWTLRTPVHGGATGMLKKAGEGTVVLASSLEVTNLLVEAGTLVISNGVSFAEGTTITVADGATLERFTPTIPNATVVVEDGGTYVCQLDVVPYDADSTTATPIDCTSFTAADRLALTKPIPITLSSAIAIPFIETNRMAVATFSAAAGFTGDDFTDASPKAYRYLPVTWFETVTEGDVTTLYLVARPVMKYAGTDNSLGAAANWTDGKSPHVGADYYSLVSGKMRTGGGSAVENWDFSGETITMAYYIQDFAQNFWVRELRLYNGSEVRTTHASSKNKTTGVTEYSTKFRPRVFKGLYVIDSSSTFSAPAAVKIDEFSVYTDFQVKLTGSGVLKITSSAQNLQPEDCGISPYFFPEGGGIYPIYFGDDAKDFTGYLWFTTSSVSTYFDAYATNGLAFGGPLETYVNNAVRIAAQTSGSNRSVISITATKDMTVNAANRGWYITTAALGASNDVTFTFSPPTLTLTEKLRKIGGGTLAMGCATVGAGTVFDVEEGYVKALSATCCTNLNLTVSDGAGLKVDAAPADEEVAAKGLIAKSIQPAEEGGEIAVAIDVPDELCGTDEFTVPVCTVPAAAPDLTGALKLKRVSGYRGEIVADSETFAADGLVTYKAKLIRMGFRLIVR